MDYSNLDNLYELFELQSKNYNKKKFLHSINADKSLNTFSWKDVLEKTILISNFLRNQGVVKGDRVMLVSEGRPEWMISDLSILRTGAVTVPNYTTYTQKDFEFVLNDCRPKGLIVSNYKLYKIIIDASKKINFNFEFILSFDEINNIMNLKKIDIKEDKVVNNCRRLDPACIIKW